MLLSMEKLSFPAPETLQEAPLIDIQDAINRVMDAIMDIVSLDITREYALMKEDSDVTESANLRISEIKESLKRERSLDVRKSLLLEQYTLALRVFEILSAAEED